jgi:hypothetical protein
MDTQDEHRPPPASDIAEWRRLANEGQLSKYSPEAIVAVVQAIGPKGDKRTLNALMKHLSDVMLRILRRTIGRNHANEGVDMIEEAHSKLILAVLKPESADGIGLCAAFQARVEFRAADAIHAGRLRADRYLYAEDDGVLPMAKKGQWSEAEELAYVESILRRIEDPRKRLAFRLHMNGVPKGSKRVDSIASALGVSAKTAGEWIAEVEDQLRIIVGDDR